MRRAIVLVIGVVLVLHGAFAAIAAEVGDGPGAESEFTSLIDQERRSSGLAGLTTSPQLVEVARRHAARMAANKDLHHNPNLPNEVQDWEVLGENVGRGGSVEDIHRAFMASESHRAQILEPRYTEVGVGVVWADGEIWVSEVFRKPQAPPPPPEPEPQPEGEVTAAEPAPASPPPAADSPPAPAPAPAQAQPAATAAAPVPAAAAVAVTAVTQPSVAAPAPTAPVPTVDEGPATALAEPVEPPSEDSALRAEPIAVDVAFNDSVPFVVEIAAGLLLLIVGMQTMTLRRLGLV